MRFDSEGNLYLYEPGSGMSGEAKRVIQYGSDEVIYGDGSVSKGVESKEIVYNKFQKLLPELVHRVVPSKKCVITNVSDGVR